MLDFPFHSPPVSHWAHLADESTYSRKKLVAITKEIVEVVYRRDIGTNGKKMVDGAKTKRDETEERDRNKIAVERCKNKGKNERERSKRKDKNDSERDKSKDKSKDVKEPERHKSKDECYAERDERKDDDEYGRDETKNENETKGDERKQKNISESEESKNNNVYARIERKDERKRGKRMTECVAENEESIDTEVKESWSVVDEYGRRKVERKNKSFGKRFRSRIYRFFHRLCICGEQRPSADA